MTQPELLFEREDPQVSNQCRRILAELRRRGRMTGVEIWQLCGAWNAKGRVFDLRQAGVDIETKWTKGVNRFGEPFRCADYVLKEAI